MSGAYRGSGSASSSSSAVAWHFDLRLTDINSNLNKPNAPIPTHGNLKWVSTTDMEAYDTPSGDPKSGDYTQESDDSSIYNSPACTNTDATSSIPVVVHIATSRTLTHRKQLQATGGSAASSSASTQ